MTIKLAILSYQEYLLEAIKLCLEEYDIELVYSSTLSKKAQ